MKGRVLILRRAQKELKEISPLPSMNAFETPSTVWSTIRGPRTPANSRHVLDFVSESAIIGSFTTSIPGDGRS